MRNFEPKDEIELDLFYHLNNFMWKSLGNDEDLLEKQREFFSEDCCDACEYICKQYLHNYEEVCGTEIEYEYGKDEKLFLPLAKSLIRACEAGLMCEAGLDFVFKYAQSSKPQIRVLMAPLLTNVLESDFAEQVKNKAHREFMKMKRENNIYFQLWFHLDFLESKEKKK